MSERRPDWPADVPNVNFPSIFLLSPSHSIFKAKKKKDSMGEMIGCLIIQLEDCIYYLLPHGLTTKLKNYNDSEGKFP